MLDSVDGLEAVPCRQENVLVVGASATRPDVPHLIADMFALIAWYQQARTMNPVERAAELHTRYLKIHPVADDNGRVARLLLNFELMKFGYPPAVIRKEDKLAYYEALDDARVTDDFNGITRLVADALKRSLDAYHDVLGLRNVSRGDSEHLFANASHKQIPDPGEFHETFHCARHASSRNPYDR